MTAVEGTGFCPLPLATIADLDLATSTDMASHPVAALWLAALLLESCFGAPTIRTTVNNLVQQQNSDVLAMLQDRVSISCMDDSTSRAGSISVNGVAKRKDGQLIIQSMSVEDQGRYECCVGDQCEEIAIISESESVRRSPYAALAVHPIQEKRSPSLCESMPVAINVLCSYVHPGMLCNLLLCPVVMWCSVCIHFGC